MHLLFFFSFYHRIAPKDSLFQKPPPSGNKPPNAGPNPNKFCSCDRPNLANVKCGFDALENPVFRLGHPSEPVRSSLPWWLRWNLSSRKKRSLVAQTNADLTDDIDDEYTFIDYGEDSATQTELTWPTWNNITEDMATDDCNVYLKQSKPYQACSGSIPQDDFEDVVQKCVDDVQVCNCEQDNIVKNFTMGAKSANIPYFYNLVTITKTCSIYNT